MGLSKNRYEAGRWLRTAEEDLLRSWWWIFPRSRPYPI